MEKRCRYVMLTKSYRSHPRLLKHTSEPFYENKLACGNLVGLNQELANAMSVVRRVSIRGPNTQPVALSQYIHLIDAQKTERHIGKTGSPFKRIGGEGCQQARKGLVPGWSQGSVRSDTLC